MPHIDLPAGVAGIGSAMAFRPETAGPLRDLAEVRNEGATDVEIHDTVLIAAAFSMYNRYVDGLATLTPSDPAAYAEMAERIVEFGYANPASAASTSRGSVARL